MQATGNRIEESVMTGLGEYRVGIDFNPSGDERVNEVKSVAAHLINIYAEGAKSVNDPEVKRLWALAQTHAEDSAMWAVKALTKKPMGA